MKKLFYLFALFLLSFSLKSQTNSVGLDNKIHRVVESMPYFDHSDCDDLTTKQKLKCAETALFEYIYSNIKYPMEAKINKVEGNVLIKFVVEKNGRLSRFEIVKDLEQGCGIAALNAVRTIEKFVPAQLNNRAVRAYYHLPIKFYLGKVSKGR